MAVGTVFIVVMAIDAGIIAIIIVLIIIYSIIIIIVILFCNSIRTNCARKWVYFF